MITMERIPEILGRDAYDMSHNKLGKIGDVYYDERTGQAEWITVQSGIFRTKETFVPIERAEMSDGEVMVPLRKDQIEGAPHVEVQPNGYLSEQDEAQLYQHYGISRPPAPAPPHVPERPPMEGAMTRSEEHMHVGKETRESGRARLRKYVETEEQRQTVPVRKETARVEREPVTEANRERVGTPSIQEEEHEVVLQEERPVVSKETRPAERVRLAKDSRTDEESVGATVRKERVEAEGVPEEERR